MVVLLFVGLAVAGAMSKNSAALTQPVSSHGPLYLSLIAAEVGLIYLVRLGLSKGGSSIAEIAGKRDLSLPAWARDIIIAAVIWAVWMGIQALVGRFTHSQPSISGLLPNGSVDRMLWIGVSVAAGVAEELTFRGYLLRQFHALTGNAWVGLVLQAAVFSIAHEYEGLAACFSIGIFGILFGMVAMKTGSLRACIIAHAWTNIAAGLL